MLSVVITIYKRTEYTEKTIASLLKNKDNPIELVVCMDGKDEKTYDNIRNLYENWQETDGTITCVVPQDQVGLVRLWNIAMETVKNHDVLVVNDDILISKGYDTVICEHLINNTFVCPLYTEGENDFAGEPKRKRTNINGHARAIKTDDRLNIGPIDERLQLWFSDDYLFRKLIDLRNRPCRTSECIVHHYRSRTIEAPENKEFVDKIIEQDKHVWQDILAEKGRFDERFADI